MFVEDLSAKHSTADSVVRTLFGLTAAECRVANALLAGDHPKRIAENFAVSENTIRTQIKALYEKTGTWRMAAGCCPVATHRERGSGGMCENHSDASVGIPLSTIAGASGPAGHFVQATGTLQIQVAGCRARPQRTAEAVR